MQEVVEAGAGREMNGHKPGGGAWPGVCSWCLSLLVLAVSTQAQLDHENSTLGVYLEPSMLQGLKTQTEELIQEAVKEGSAAMTRGSLTVQFLSSMNENITLPDEMTAVLTLASCSNTRAWAPSLAKMGKLHIAITGSGCSRIAFSSAITVPLTSGSKDVVQVFRDLRDKNTLIWTDIIFIHDNTIDLGSCSLRWVPDQGVPRPNSSWSSSPRTRSTQFKTWDAV